MPGHRRSAAAERTRRAELLNSSLASASAKGGRGRRLVSAPGAARCRPPPGPAVRIAAPAGRRERRRRYRPDRSHRHRPACGQPRRRRADGRPGLMSRNGRRVRPREGRQAVDNRCRPRRRPRRQLPARSMRGGGRFRRWRFQQRRTQPGSFGGSEAQEGSESADAS